MFLLFSSDWISTAADGVMGAMEKGIRTLTFSLCTHVYKLIINLYNFFEALCTGRLLSSDLVSAIAERIGFILGLVMLFYVIFSFIKMMVDPDSMEDKERGAVAIVKRVLIVIVMLGVSNFFFNTLYHVQRVVVREHVIANLLLPSKIESINGEEGLKDFGRVLSEELIYAFYQPENFEGSEVENDSTVSYCTSMVNLFRNQIINQGRFDLGYNCLNESVTVDVNTKSAAGTQKDQEIFVIYYNWPMCFLVGILVAYFLIMYCIQVGVRMVQLMFLEVISPMAIVSYLAPKKDTMFSKWWKIYFSTYIDVFIRIAIINFVIFLIATIFAVDKNSGFKFWESIGVTENTPVLEKSFFVVILVIALLIFAKKAPDLLKELLPGGAAKLGFGLKSPKALFGDMLGGGLIQKGLTTGAKVATAGVATGLLGSITSGASRFNANRALGKKMLPSIGAGLFGGVTGLGRGLIAGGKKGNVFKNIATGMTNQRKADNAYTNLVSSGGSTLGKMGSRVTDLFTETTGQRYNRQLADLDQMDQYKKSMNSAADEISFVKSAKDAWEQTTQFEGESIDDYEARKQEAFDRYRYLRNSAIDAAVSGNNTLLDENGYAILDANGNAYTFDNVDDDKMYAADITSIITQADSYSTSHNVQYWDETDESYKNVGHITNRKSLGDASTNAHKTKTHITGSKNYSASIANDKAAGVSDRRSSGKRN